MGRASRFLVAGACATLLAAAGAQAQERLEIFSWWTDGDGGSGLQTLVQQYNARFPDVAVTNAAAAVGPGVDARTVLRLRMLAGNPPDSFQVHGGQELIGTWVAANRMEDLSGFYRIQGLMNKLPRSFISLLSSKTGIWSIPLAVNRTNVIWFIPSRLQAWGVTPPRTWDELIAACRKLKDGGLETPLAAGGPTALGSLWECAALASLGPASWNELWAGKVRFTDPQALRAWDNFGPAAELANQDASEISWQQAIDRLMKGQAAFAIMGDWAAGYMSGALKLVPGTDFAWAPSPGTAGAFMASCDTFDLPRGQKTGIRAQMARAHQLPGGPGRLQPAGGLHLAPPGLGPLPVRRLLAVGGPRLASGRHCREPGPGDRGPAVVREPVSRCARRLPVHPGFTGGRECGPGHRGPGGTGKVSYTSDSGGAAWPKG